MKKEIQINGETWFYSIYEDSDYDFYHCETRFFKNKTKKVTKRKYILFGEKYEVEVEKKGHEADFILNYNIENVLYTKEEVKEEIQKGIKLFLRAEEINRGEII